jgi:hypothetical protein
MRLKVIQTYLSYPHSSSLLSSTPSQLPHVGPTCHPLFPPFSTPTRPSILSLPPSFLRVASPAHRLAAAGQCSGGGRIHLPDDRCAELQGPVRGAPWAGAELLAMKSSKGRRAGRLLRGGSTTSAARSFPAFASTGERRSTPATASTGGPRSSLAPASTVAQRIPCPLPRSPLFCHRGTPPLSSPLPLAPAGDRPWWSGQSRPEGEAQVARDPALRRRPDPTTTAVLHPAVGHSLICATGFSLLVLVHDGGGQCA